MGGRVQQWTQQPHVRPGEGWVSSDCTLPKTHHPMTTHNHTTPDRSPSGSTRTAPSAVHQDGGVKYATGASSKIWGRDNTTIGTWNKRTLKAAGKLQELTWNGQVQMEHPWTLKWDGRTLAKQLQRKDPRFFSVEKEDKHEHGIGFLVHKDIMNTVMGCRPVSSRLITIRMRAVPFNITIVQV